MSSELNFESIEPKSIGKEAKIKKLKEIPYRLNYFALWIGLATSLASLALSINACFTKTKIENMNSLLANQTTEIDSTNSLIRKINSLLIKQDSQIFNQQSQITQLKEISTGNKGLNNKVYDLLLSTNNLLYTSEKTNENINSQLILTQTNFEIEQKIEREKLKKIYLEVDSFASINLKDFLGGFIGSVSTGKYNSSLFLTLNLMKRMLEDGQYNKFLQRDNIYFDSWLNVLFSIDRLIVWLEEIIPASKGFTEKNFFDSIWQQKFTERFAVFISDYNKFKTISQQELKIVKFLPN